MPHDWLRSYSNAKSIMPQPSVACDSSFFLSSRASPHVPLMSRKSRSNLSTLVLFIPDRLPPATLQGEWLAFSSRAEEAGFWDVGASVAVGFNGSSISYRLLVNATNCSSAETDGYDGLGSVGVDLLNGPVQYEYTGSWEAFEMAMKEEVWVPQGEHRVLFCADSGLFNLNYLRFWTPTPTPAPTPVPSPAPTACLLYTSDAADE